VVFGATVTVEDTDTSEQQTYRIVGEDEADIKSGRISVTAPVSRAMIGREVGDTVKVRTPKGMREARDHRREVRAFRVVPVESQPPRRRRRQDRHEAWRGKAGRIRIRPPHPLGFWRSWRSLRLGG
jgi:hypothetical protein